MDKETDNYFWQFDAGYWFQQLNSTDNGLSQAAAERIVAAAGSRPRTRSRFQKDAWLLAGQFKNPLMLLLVGAIVISGFLGETSDVFIILFILLSSGLLSYFQERNAGKVVEKLQSLISIKSTVLRDGQARELPSAQIVAGDVILLNAGDMLPADCLILESNELYANESSLTGESYPSKKAAGLPEADAELSARTNCLWQGTNIVSGHAKALVIRTGDRTLLGGIASGASTTVETTFEKGIKDFGFLLMKITLTLSIFILIVNLLYHKNIIDSALFALALAVGMAPELLPAITTIAMSAGARRLLDKKVIVKKLNSIQNLGEVDLLCTDKTGTITEGTIAIAGLTDAMGRESEWVKQLAFWNATFESGYANPIDEALKQLAIREPVLAQKTGEVPYDFIRKMLSIAIRTEQAQLLISKGAFTQILGICTRIHLGEQNIADIAPYRQTLAEKFEQFGLNGLRAIGICYKTIDTGNISKALESDMIFAGFILMNDPVKQGIQDTVSELHKLKVGLKVITGDNRNVAESIARQIGFRQPVIMTGKELLHTSSEALVQLVKKTHIFAEVEPQQKERIILALKRHHTVAYLGDGINDVSAIKAADVGISVENAVDVAREAADFVLMEKDLLVLAEGIREGRKTFANTMKYLYISTGSTFGNMCSVAAASLVLPFLPMLPKQILLNNFITDFPFLTVTTDNVDQEQLKKPGKWNLKVIRNYMIVFGIHSSFFDILTFVTLYLLLKAKESEFQTGWFVESVLTELFIVFIIRTRKSFFNSRPGRYLFVFSLLALVVTLGLPYMPLATDIGLSPLPWDTLGAILLIVAAYVVTADWLKIWFFKKHPGA